MPENRHSMPKVQKHQSGSRWSFRVCVARDCDERIYRFMARWGRKYCSDECQQMAAKLQREQRKQKKWDQQSEFEKAKKTLH